MNGISRIDTSETEPLHAAGPPDDPDEDVTAGADDIYTVATDADSAADIKTVIYSDSAVLDCRCRVITSSASDSVVSRQGTPFFLVF